MFASRRARLRNPNQLHRALNRWPCKCASHPDELETTICKHAPGAVRIGLETGPLTTWLWRRKWKIGGRPTVEDSVTNKDRRPKTKDKANARPAREACLSPPIMRP
jgi:hypothetical protein